MGGTPKIVRSVRRNSQTRIIEKEMALPDDETLSKKIGSAYMNQKTKMNQSVISMLPPSGQGLGNRNLKQDAKSGVIHKSRAGSVNTSFIGD